MSTTTSTTVTHIGTVVIPVADVDGAIAFYVDKLGLEKRVDIPFGNGYRWVEVGPAGAQTTIALAPPPPGKSSGKAETGICLHTPDIDAYHAQLKERGVDVDAEISRMGDPVPPMFFFRDQDNNRFLIVQRS